MEGYISSEILIEALRLVDEMERKSLAEKESLGYIFSKGYKKKKKRILKRAKSYELIRLPYIVRQIAMIAIMLIGGLLVITVTIPAARAKILEVIEKVFDTHTDIQLKKGDSFEILMKKPFSITKLPKGFRLVRETKGESEYYENQSGDFISFQYTNFRGVTLWANERKMKIKQGQLYNNLHKFEKVGNTSWLTWVQGEQTFRIATSLEEKEAYRLAKNIQQNMSKYVPTYIPEGYKLTYKDEMLGGTFEYKKGDSYIAIDYSTVDSGSIMTDNEHTNMIKGYFKGCPSYYLKQRGENPTNTLIWYDHEYFFSVTTQVSKNETYKIADHLKRKD